MNIDMELFTYENSNVRNIAKGILKQISIDCRANNIDFDLYDVIDDNHISYKDIVSLIDRYNSEVSKKTRTILVPLYNIPMV